MEGNTSYKDKYEIKELLGQGGNGIVHKAIQRSTNKEVAIKKFDKKKNKRLFYEGKFQTNN